MKNIIVLPVTYAHLDGACNCEKGTQEAWSREQLAQELESECGRLFVAIDQDKIVGVAVFQITLDEVSLNSITVLPEYRGKGIGKVLLSECIQALEKQGGRNFYLEVRTQNAPAIALYTSLDFVSAGLRKAFYSDPSDDAIIMSLERQ